MQGDPAPSENPRNLLAPKGKRKAPLRRRTYRLLPDRKQRHSDSLFLSAYLQAIRQLFCIAVSRSIGNHNALFFRTLTLPTAKAGGFLFLPPLHWQIPYGTAMSYTVSTGYIYTVPACPAVQFSYPYADCSCSPFSKY